MPNMPGVMFEENMYEPSTRTYLRQPAENNSDDDLPKWVECPCISTSFLYTDDKDNGMTYTINAQFISVWGARMKTDVETHFENDREAHITLYWPEHFSNPSILASMWQDPDGNPGFLEREGCFKSAALAVKKRYVGNPAEKLIPIKFKVVFKKPQKSEFFNREDATGVEVKEADCFGEDGKALGKAYVLVILTSDKEDTPLKNKKKATVTTGVIHRRRPNVAAYTMSPPPAAREPSAMGPNRPLPMLYPKSYPNPPHGGPYGNYHFPFPFSAPVPYSAPDAPYPYPTGPAGYPPAPAPAGWG